MMTKEEKKKWKRLKSIHLGHPCHDCGINATRSNFIGKGWHWKRVGYGIHNNSNVIKICGSCSGKRGLPVPFMIEFFNDRS